MALPNISTWWYSGDGLHLSRPWVYLQCDWEAACPERELFRRRDLATWLSLLWFSGWFLGDKDVSTIDTKSQTKVASAPENQVLVTNINAYRSVGSLCRHCVVSLRCELDLLWSLFYAYTLRCLSLRSINQLTAVDSRIDDLLGCWGCNQRSGR
jgi:hypothetical protein